MKCFLCPRKCGADRSDPNSAFCKSSNNIKAARAALHTWEEPCISGEEGSGTIFFCGCNLGCIYCQNRDIALSGCGEEITQSRLYEIFFELKEKGANNINLVTAGHFLNEIIPVLKKAKSDGFPLPFVYNTSAYETVEAIKCLDGLIDIYLPDYKYEFSSLAEKYSSAKDYPDVAKKAIREMVRQSKKNVFDDRGIMQKGIIVRHLLLPGETENSKAAIKYLYETYKDSIYISIMSQYTPFGNLPYENLNRTVSADEYDDLVDYAIDLGVVNGFIQEGEAASESFIPSFDSEGIRKG